MPRHENSPIARTIKAAKKLGHESVPLKMDTLSDAEQQRGLHFASTGKRRGSICFVGLCDPDTKVRLVAYYDANGNCNDFVKVKC